MALNEVREYRFVQKNSLEKKPHSARSQNATQGIRGGHIGA